MISSIVLLGLVILMALVFLPVLITYLKGMRRIFVVLQQVCIIIYLSLTIVHISHFIKPSALDLHKVFGGSAKHANPISLGIGRQLLDFFKFFFYFEYYFFSLMQTVDLYQMICQPFHYESFSTFRNIAKLAFVGSGICFLLAIEPLIETVVFFHAFGISIEAIVELKDFFFNIRIYTVVKLICAKAVYALIAGKLAYDIRQKLNESSAMQSNKQRESAHENLFRFNLIPLFVNILLIGHDIPTLKFLFNEINDCSLNHTEPILILISATSFTLTSFSYSIGYIVFFPKIRAAIQCRQCKCTN